MSRIGRIGLGRVQWVAAALVILVGLVWLAKRPNRQAPAPPAPPPVGIEPAPRPPAAPGKPAQAEPPDIGKDLPKPPSKPTEVLPEPTPERPPVPASDGFALIPAGSFSIGNALAASGDGHSNELPVRAVTLSAFQIGQHEVTQALWAEVRTWAGTHGYTDLPPGMGKAPSHPVQSVNWYAVVKWCNARSEKENLTACYTLAGQIYRIGDGVPDCNWTANGYRLPTEAEWEKAARGGLSGMRFPWGDTITHKVANFRNDGGEFYQSGTTGDRPAYGTGAEPYTAPVGAFPANASGLSDMAGNVWEWCWDWYGPYPSAAAPDPRGAASGTLRVYRGGSWRSNACDCRSAARYYSYPGGSYNYVGFRVVKGVFNDN